MSIENIKTKLYDKYKGNYSIVEKTYIDTKHKAEFLCNIHNLSFYGFPSNVVYGKCAGCEECKKLNKKNVDISKIIPKILNKNIDIVGTHLYKNHIFIDFKCQTCKKSFSQRKDPIVYKDNEIDCPHCNNKPNRYYNNGLWEFKRKTTDEFKQEVFGLVQNEYSVIGKYTLALEQIDIKHNICGKVWSITPNNFLSGERCPYCSCSKGEKSIETFLNDYKIEYEPQKKFEKLFGVGGGTLSYDFYLPNYNMLIEFQGEQHEKPKDFFGGEDTFIIQQEHDKRKREYAKKNNIKLLEIWYYDFDNIENILKSHLVV